MSKYLRIVPPEEIDAATLAHIQRAARQAQCNVTVFEGTITSVIYICMHRGPTPSAEFIKQHEDKEFAAMPIASGVSN